MQIKRFEAPTMTDALRMVKKEFGAEAVILSARSHKKQGGLFGTLRKSGVVITAAIDNIATTPQLTAQPEARPKFLPGNQGEASSQGSTAAPTTTPAAAAAPDKRITFGKGLFRALTGGGRSAQPAAAPAEKPEGPPEKTRMERQFIRQGVEKHFADELLTEIVRLCPVHDALEMPACKSYFIKALENLGVTCCPGPAVARRQRIVVFVGPPGVGKTSSVTKLAGIKALQDKQQVGLITLDSLRIGAISQLAIYARILGVPLEAASDGKEYRNALKKFKAMDVILVDTPGISFNETDKILELKDILNRQRPDEMHLVVSACTKNGDLHTILSRFRLLAINRLLVTKVDESQSFGNIVNLLLRANLPLAYVTNGQNFPESIAAASFELLADLVLEIPAAVAPPQPFLLTERTPVANAPVPMASGVYNRYGTVATAVDDDEPDVQEKLAAPGFGAPSDSYLVANRNSDRFHYSDCPCIKRIKKENLMLFKTAEAAMAQNFKACQICNRDEAILDHAEVNLDEKQLIGGVH